MIGNIQDTSEENFDRTVLEPDRTVLEKKPAPAENETKSAVEDPSDRSQVPKRFKEYSIVKQLVKTGGEADIFLIDGHDREYILKLYRYGIAIKEGILKKTFEVSSSNSNNLVKIYDSGFDEESKRWYEILEYLPAGSLENHKKSFVDKHDDVRRIISEINEGLKTLHQENIIHRDLKPSNILIRTLNPINLVISDFGISSVLESEVSRKMTGIEGTPNYWSPESISGVVGKEADYWALGMIVFELLHGSHPFARFDMKVIMYTLSTKGIEIPADLGEPFILLVKGLLTRDPKYRWSYEQVCRWLSGERDIPVYFEEVTEKRRKYGKAYKFHEKKYYSLEALFESFFENEVAWEDGSVHLHKGYVDKWLEENGDFDRVIELAKIRKTPGIDSELKMIKYTYTFLKEAPFIFLGKLISIPNLLLFAGRILNEENSREEEKIITHLLSNRLGMYYSHYLEMTGREEDLLSSLFKVIGRMSADMNNYNYSLKSTHTFLKILNSIEDYILPFNEEGLTIEKLEFINDYLDQIITREDYGNIIRQYLVPGRFLDLDAVTESEQYLEITRAIKDFDSKRLFFPAHRFEELKAKKILTSPMLESLNVDDIKTLREGFEKFNEFDRKNIFVDRAAFTEVDIKSVVPEVLRRQIMNGDFDSYAVAVSELNLLEEEFLLISREQISFLKKNGLMNDLEIREIQLKSLEEYKIEAQRIRNVEWDLGMITEHELAVLAEKFIIPLCLDRVLNAEIKEPDLVKKLRNLQKSKLLIRKKLLEQLKVDYIFPQDIISGIFDSDIEVYEKSSRRINELISEDILIPSGEFEILSQRYIVPEKITESINSSQYLTYVFGARQLKDMRSRGQLIEKSEYNEVIQEFFVPDLMASDLKGTDISKYLLVQEKLQVLKSFDLLIPKGKVFETGLQAEGYKIRNGFFAGDYSRYLKASISIKSGISDIMKGRLRAAISSMDRVPWKSRQVMSLKNYLEDIESCNIVWTDQDRQLVETLNEIRMTDHYVIFLIILFSFLGMGNFVFGLGTWYLWAVPFLLAGLAAGGGVVLMVYAKTLGELYKRESKRIDEAINKAQKAKKVLLFR